MAVFIKIAINTFTSLETLVNRLIVLLLCVILSSCERFYGIEGKRLANRTLTNSLA